MIKDIIRHIPQHQMPGGLPGGLLGECCHLGHWGPRAHDSKPALHAPGSGNTSQLRAPACDSRSLCPSFPCGVTPGDDVTEAHPRYPLQTVSGTDCMRQGRSPRQPTSRGSTDSFLISEHFFLFSHFCCSPSAPAHCRRGKETGKVKATHAQALPSSSPAPLQQSQILAAAAAAASSAWALPISTSMAVAQRAAPGSNPQHHQGFLQRPHCQDQKSPTALCIPPLAGPDVLKSSNQMERKGIICTY